jgi:hypothetical protein
MMEKLVGICGLDCMKCPAFIAKKNNDDELRKKTADEWSKQFNQTITPESINCDGCMSTGEHISYADICEIRKCGTEKKVESCAYCDDYACEKLDKWFKNVPDAKNTLDEIRKNR